MLKMFTHSVCFQPITHTCSFYSNIFANIKIDKYSLLGNLSKGFPSLQMPDSIDHK